MLLKKTTHIHHTYIKWLKYIFEITALSEMSLKWLIDSIVERFDENCIQKPKYVKE